MFDVLRFLCYNKSVTLRLNALSRPQLQPLETLRNRVKVTGCFRTDEGVAMFCRIRSYLSTLRKQGIELFSALEHTLTGHPVLPSFT